MGKRLENNRGYRFLKGTRISRVWPFGDETKEKNQDLGGCEQKNIEKISSLASHEP